MAAALAGQDRRTGRSPSVRVGFAWMGEHRFQRLHDPAIELYARRLVELEKGRLRTERPLVGPRVVIAFHVFAAATIRASSRIASPASPSG